MDLDLSIRVFYSSNWFMKSMLVALLLFTNTALGNVLCSGTFAVGDRDTLANRAADIYGTIGDAKRSATPNV
jgi:hypothetical protein